MQKYSYMRKAYCVCHLFCVGCSWSRIIKTNRFYLFYNYMLINIIYFCFCFIFMLRSVCWLQASIMDAFIKLFTVAYIEPKCVSDIKLQICLRYGVNIHYVKHTYSHSCQIWNIIWTIWQFALSRPPLIYCFDYGFYFYCCIISCPWRPQR